MQDLFDMPPSGFYRVQNGWLIKVSTGVERRVAELEAENKYLREKIKEILEKLDVNTNLQS